VITSGGRLARVEGISGDTLQTSKRTTRVPGGHVFLAGAGKVETTPLEALRGRALFIAYPLERRGWLQ